MDSSTLHYRVRSHVAPPALGHFFEAAVQVVAIKGIDLAKFAARDRVSQPQVQGRRAQYQIASKLEPAFGRHPQSLYLRQLRQASAQRLFNKDVLACRQRGAHLSVVSVVETGDRDNVQGSIGQHRLETLGNLAVGDARADGARSLKVVIVQADAAHCGMPRVSMGVLLPDPKADHSCDQASMGSCARAHTATQFENDGNDPDRTSGSRRRRSSSVSTT